MSSQEEPRHEKPKVNETGKEKNEFDPQDVEQVKRNISSNADERKKNKID